MNSNPMLLSGAPGSPYTRKMLALLRYRRIPYRYVVSVTGIPGLPQARPPLLPTFYLPDAAGDLQAVTDSTPLIRRFEAEHAGRSAIPTDPALAFLDALLEDFADEWLTKAMFHYRWTYAADVHKAGRILGCWIESPVDDAALARYGNYISSRQIARLSYVGSHALTGPVIEAGFVRFLDAFEDHLRQHRFLLGARPGAADFAVFGQLTQLTQFDPTPMALATERAPRVCAWVTVLEDLSGLEPADADWLDAAALPPSLQRLLKEAGSLYAPLMLANARALAAGESEVHAVVGGQPWRQQTLTYQGKCLAWLQRDYLALAPPERARVDAALHGSGCEALFEADALRLS